MSSRHPLILDLNNLFSPAISGGPQELAEIEGDFVTIHKGLMALRRSGKLGFAALPGEDLICEHAVTLARRFKKVKNILVFGIGGSALGTSSLYLALKGPWAHLRTEDSPRLFVLDNIEAKALCDLVDLLGQDDNLFVFVSKSGNTSETLAQYLFAKKHFPKFSAERTVIITDPHKGFLHDLVAKNNFNHLTVPPSVGGRFSVFSSVGLFPLAVCGLDVKNLLDGAAHMEKLCHSDVLAQNPAALLAVTLHYWSAKKGISQFVMMPYADHLRLFSDWFAQLFAESLGKKHDLNGKLLHAGVSALKALGVTDQHSQLQLYLDGPRDKLVMFIEVEDAFLDAPLDDAKHGDERIDFLSGKNLRELLLAEKKATEESLRESNCPNLTIKMPEINAFQLGQLYQLMMNAVVYLGALMNINPFDQPAVEKIKEFTFGLMGKPGFDEFSVRMASRQKRGDLVF